MTVRAGAAVLIVDDDGACRAVLRLACESVGIDVAEATTGAAALEQALAGSFAVILLDLGLPDISGLEVCRRLRAQDVVTPIVIVSAQSGPAQVELGLAAGADDYVGKPYRLARVLARVEAYTHAAAPMELPGQPVEERAIAGSGDAARRAERHARRPRRHEFRP